MNDLVHSLGPLLSAEAAAEAPSGTEPSDLEQAVWLRLLEVVHEHGPPPAPAAWLRAAVRGEARRLRRRARREGGYEAEPAAAAEACPERIVLRAEHGRRVRAAVSRLPGPCPRVLGAMLAREDLTYREIAGALGISQGSLGPQRSRCLACLRRILAAEVAAPHRRGKVR
ncbi:RNA polymerase sigma factor [Streptomyces sp. KLOTTS4A1]|uniref:RNA polymerase sigma factor n=1 Tax=Streptomyces sp. KLOTTS4A1 TaxID=3390996 RepID=UPI0039F640D4